MSSYNTVRQKYKPSSVKWLLITESPPPAADVASSRHFYRTDTIRRGDRLFISTMRALYMETQHMTEHELETNKEAWLRRFQADGWYMIEALEVSLPHEVTKQQRQEAIHRALPQLLSRVRELVIPVTTIILVKSNVFEVACQPLRESGFTVGNTKLVDYPGQFNQRAYQEKVAQIVRQNR